MQQLTVYQKASPVVIFGRALSIDGNLIHIEQLDRLGLSDEQKESIKKAYSANLENHPNESDTFVSDFSDELHKTAVILGTTNNEQIEQFLKSDSKTKEILALNDRLPFTAMSKLAYDTDDKVRYKLAQNPNLPPSLIDWMVNDTSEMVRSMICRHQPLSPKAIKKFADDDIIVQVELIKRDMELPDDIYRHFLLSDNVNIQLGLARRDELPKWAMIELAKHKSPAVRRAIAECKKLPKEVFEILSNDNDRSIQLSVIHRFDFPSMLMRKYCTGEVSSELKILMAKLPQLQHDMVKKLANDDNEDVRYHIAKRNDLDEETIYKLISDRSSFVRIQACKQKSLPIKALDRLVTDACTEVRRLTAERNDLRLPHVEKLISDYDRDVKWAMRKNPLFEKYYPDF